MASGLPLFASLELGSELFLGESSTMLQLTLSRRARWWIGLHLSSALAALATTSSCRQLLGYDDFVEYVAGGGDGGGVVPVGEDSGGEAPPRRCSKNAECSQPNGRPSLCVDSTLKEKGFCREIPHSCEILPDRSVVDVVGKADPFLIGFFVPGYTSPHAAIVRRVLEKSLRLAPNVNNQTVAVLACDSVQQLESTFNLLVEQYKLSAVVVGFDDVTLTNILQNYSDEQSRPFILNVSAENPATKDQNSIVNMLGPVEDLAGAYLPLIERAKQQLMANIDGAVPSVAIVYDDTPINRGLAEKIVDLYEVAHGEGQIDKKCVHQETSGTHEPCVTMMEPQQVPVQWKEQVAPPNIVVSLVYDGYNTPDDKNFDTIVKAYDSEGVLWVTGPYNAQESARYQNQHLRSNLRFVGVQYAGAQNSEEREQFVEFLGPELKEYASLENYYDALFYLTYAAWAGGKNEPKEIAVGFGKMRGFVSNADSGVTKLVVGQPGDAYKNIKPENTEYEVFGASGRSSQFVGKYKSTWKSSGAAYCVRSAGNGEILYDVLREDGDGGLKPGPVLTSEVKGTICQPVFRKGLQFNCGFPSAFAEYCAKEAASDGGSDAGGDASDDGDIGNDAGEADADL